MKNKKDWIKLLKRDLIPCPQHNDGEHKNEFTTPKDLAIQITAKKRKRNRYYSFGSIYCAILDFSNSKILKISFLCPIKKSLRIKIDEITGINFYHFTATK